MSVGRIGWLAVFFSVLIWSGVDPKDFTTWLLEVMPALIAIALLFYTRNSFPLTTLTYTLILIHSVILMVGGHYTYAEVPIGDMFRELFESSRNNYDKLGHVAQGFIPVVIAREVVIRLNVFKSKAWMNFFIVSMCLGISAFYELIEWWVALMSGEAADAFLGTQGYVWDTQSDMGFALTGAIVALLLLSGVHDRQLGMLSSAD